MKKKYEVLIVSEKYDPNKPPIFLHESDPELKFYRDHSWYEDEVFEHTNLTLKDWDLEHPTKRGGGE